MMASNLKTILFLVSFCETAFTSEDAAKRLLVGPGDSPTAESSQLLSLQREIQTLQTKIAEIDVHQSQIQFLNAQVSQLQQENNALKLQGSSHLEVQTLSDKMATLENKVNEVVGINQNLTQHSGITGGKRYSHSGSGTNNLCLPHDPDSLSSDFPATTYSGHDAYLYGAEYQFTYKNVAIDDDVPCAIGKVSPATTAIMVPAKFTCPQNWTLQYHGYLAASYYLENASDFICIDSEPEFFEGLRLLNSDGLLLYPVRMECGSLPCPKYKNTQYLPCAVCTF